MINSITRQWFNASLYPLLRGLMTTFQCNMYHRCLLKKPSARKFLCQFTETLDVKPKTDFCRLCASKSKHKAIRAGSMLWSSIWKQHIHNQINECVEKYLYKFILYHPQVVQSPIANDRLRFYIYGQSGPQLVLKLLLQLSFIEPHNTMSSTP